MKRMPESTVETVEVDCIQHIRIQLAIGQL